MKLYHVSVFLQDKKVLFKPRVPKSAAEGENATIERICFSTSIENCIKAIGPSKFKSGTKFMIFEADIDADSESLIPPQALFDRNYVKDALENEEYWYTDSIELDGKFYIIENIDYEPQISLKCVTIDEIKSILLKVSSGFKFVTDLNLESADEYYEHAMYFCNLNRLYNLADDVYDTITEQIKYAQNYKINKLKIKEISEGAAVPIERITKSDYYRYGQKDLCNELFEDNKCTKDKCGNCGIQYLYRSLAEREDYESFHALKLVYGCNLLLINNNTEFENILNIISKSYTYVYYEAKYIMSTDISDLIDGELTANLVAILDFRKISYTMSNIRIIANKLQEYKVNNPGVKIIIIENKKKKIINLIQLYSNIILEQVDDSDEYKVIKSFPMKYANDEQHVNLTEVL
jgi:hypothetical protein